MTKIRTDSLAPGMAVGLDIKNLDGMLLLPAGCELSERHIRMLRMWGITDVAVMGSGEHESGQAPQASVPANLAPETVAAVKGRFWCLEEDNLVHQEILRLLLWRKTKASSSRQ